MGRRNVKSKIIRVRVSQELYGKLELVSFAVKRSKSEIIRRALREFLKNVLRKQR